MNRGIVAGLIAGVCAVLSGCNPNPSSSDPVYHTGSKTLNVQPVAQQLTNWCWLASGQMIFQYFGIPSVNNASYQCGEIAAFTGPQSPCYYDCTQCNVGSGTSQNAALLLQIYPQVVQQVYPGQRIVQLTPYTLNGPLTPAQAEQQIDGGRPVEVGITPEGPFTGTPSHAVVLVGYIAPQDQNGFQVVINDPYPYDQAQGPENNPYLQRGATEQIAGQYVMNYAAFVSEMLWTFTAVVVPS